MAERRGGVEGGQAGQGAAWSNLPGDVLLLVEAVLASSVMPSECSNYLASMRASCRSWWWALAAAPAHLQPLGKPAPLPAFPRAASLGYAARGAGQSLTDGELEAACTQLGPRLQSLDIGGAYQLSTAGLAAALCRCLALRHLTADGSTLQDAVFAAVAQAGGGGDEGAAAGQPAGVPGSSRGSGGSTGSSSSSSLAAASGPVIVAAPLQRLESLSLRGCLFLQGSLLADLATACPALASLDLAGCGLALNLSPGTLAALPRMRNLERLVLDGNGVDDAAMQHIEALPRLRELSVRGSTHMTDAALHALAQRRGSRGERGAANGGSSSGGSGGGGGGSGGDVGIVALDISCCTGLTDQCWLAITEMQGLTSLWMEHMAHLLQFPAMPEGLPAALWRLPRLRCLSLAGSCCHPSKLKLLTASCGSSITHLDLGTGGTQYRSSGSGSTGGMASSSPLGSPRGGPGGSSPVAGGVPPWAMAAAPPPGVAQQAVGPAYRRLTSLHERDLCEAAQQCRQLQSFSAAGSGLPLRVCTAFLAAAPAGRLSHLDLRGCCLDAEPPAAAAAHCTQPPWQQQLFFSSGARRALNFDSYPAVTGTSASRLQQLHAEADSWQRPATAGRFASALRRQAASLTSLQLSGAGGVTDRHLSSLSALGALTVLCLAGTGGAVSRTLMAEVAAGCPRLQYLDVSGTAADNGCLAAAAALPRLCQLSVADCPGVGAAGIAALAAGPASRQLSWLDLSGTAANDAAVAALAAACGELRGINLTGCRELTPLALDSLRQLPRLTSLGLGRCPGAVTDAGLLQLAHGAPRLTWLNLTEARQLTAEGLAAVLPLLPCLAHLDLTAASNERLRDEQLLQLLVGTASSSSASGSSGSSTLTPANVQLPQGGTSPTGSPFKRRAAAPA